MHLFLLDDLSVETITEHLPELLKEDGTVDKDAIMDIMFKELKRIRRIALQNQYALE